MTCGLPRFLDHATERVEYRYIGEMLEKMPLAIRNHIQARHQEYAGHSEQVVAQLG